MTTIAETPAITVTDNPPATKSIAEPAVSDSKEQEAPSSNTAPSSASAMDQDTECKVDAPSSASNDSRETDLLAAGTKLLRADKFEEAVPLLSDALELIQKKGVATDIKSVPYYMAYGEGLLRLVQSSNDLFAAPAPEQPDEDEDDEEVDAPPMIADATETDPDTASASEAPATSETASEAANGKDEASPSPPKEPEATAKASVDTSMDREIAWETFEYARTIMEDHLAIKAHAEQWHHVKRLAECHAFLGEICIEDERNEAALTEFTEALALQDRCKEGVVGCRERAYNHFYACLAAQFSEKEEQALTHCEVALKALSERMTALMAGLGCADEFKETQEVLDAAGRCVAGLQSEAAASSEGRELASLLSVAGDLVAKLEEVQGVIKFKAENPKPAKKEPVDLLAAADPLSALINGLVSKCGIDESEVAKLDTQIESEQAKEAKEQDKDKPQGVTTIGFGSVSASGDKAEEDEEVHEIVVVKKRRKRKLEETEMGQQTAEAHGKKMKLNTGGAMVVDSGKTTDAETNKEKVTGSETEQVKEVATV